MANTTHHRIPLLAVAVCAAGLALAGCGSHVDEHAWRHDVEEALGHKVHDWQTYNRLALKQCEAKGDNFDYSVATFLDNGIPANIMRINVRDACPDRQDDLTEVLNTLAHPCAGMDAHERKQIQQAADITC
ncbi:MAG: hypothetical protein ACRDMV_01090 [Streptosporangiales bacterium]